MSRYLSRRFFERDPLTCAQDLIGCELVWNDCAGLVVETEAYRAVGDEASHTFFRPSAREFIAKHRPGTAYVYFNYGMYWLLNVLVKDRAVPGAAGEGFVLFRALAPTRGADLMRQRREARRKSPLAHPRQLCSGPGKLTLALGVDGADHGRDLCAGGTIGFYPAKEQVDIVADGRIGISRAQEFPWRFTLRGSEHVSVRPKV